MADYDAEGQPLTGNKHYELHFPAGQLPPADAFWSVSMYSADRFFVENPIRRHAVGDRTEGLQFNADGSLTIPIQHEAPAGFASNWLPAPQGAFYLILRCYHPREALLAGRYAIPPVREVTLT